MSVFYENQGRRRDDRVGAPLRGAEFPRIFKKSETARRRRADDAPLWGFSYDRAEGVIHLLLAFSLVGGAAAMIWGFISPEAAAVSRPGGETAATRAAPQPPPKPVAAIDRPERIAATEPVSQPLAAPPPAQIKSAPPAQTENAPAAQAMSAAPTAQAMSAAPAAQAVTAPEALAPPPPDLREKLGASVVTSAQEPAAAPEPPLARQQARAEAEPAPPALEKVAEAPVAGASDAERGRMARCFVKLSGRVQTSGMCRVEVTDNGVIFQLPGKPLEISYRRGRVWTASLGGRTIATVYKSGSCWGARGFYACKNG